MRTRKMLTPSTVKKWTGCIESIYVCGKFVACFGDMNKETVLLRFYLYSVCDSTTCRSMTTTEYSGSSIKPTSI